MKIYELTYLISPDLSEEELRSLQEKINSFIKDGGGILVDELRSSPPFANARVNEVASVLKKTFTPFRDKSLTGFSYLGTLSFQFSPEKLENFEKKLKSEEKLLRYMILTKPPTTFRKKVVEERKLSSFPFAKAREVEEKPAISRKKVVGGKVELEEIEKKLEEILRE